MQIVKTYDIGKLVEKVQKAITNKRSGSITLDLITANDILDVLQELEKTEAVEGVKKLVE